MFCPQCAKPLEARREGERPRPVCPDKACGFVLWENPTPVVAAFLDELFKSHQVAKPAAPRAPAPARRRR